MRHTSTPESMCSSRRIVKLTLKLTKEIIVFATKNDKTAMDTVITGKRDNPAKGVKWQSASET
jgi:hypothetical protein